MRVENLLNFAIDVIQPRLPGTIIEDTEEAIEKNPNQIHLKTKLSVGEMIIRVDQKNPNEQIMTIWGGNPEASPKITICVNGDDSWEKELEKTVRLLQSDPYLCIPLGPNED